MDVLNKNKLKKLGEGAKNLSSRASINARVAR